MKKIIILMLCIVLLIFTLTGCKNGKDNDILDNNTNVNYETTDKTDNNADIANADSEDESNDKSDNNITDTPAESKVTNASNRTGLILKDALLKNYIEKQIYIGSVDIEKKESFSSSVFNAEGYIEHYFTSDMDGNTIVWKYILNDDGTLKKEEVTWLNGLKNKIDQKRIIIFLGEDGNYYAHYVEKGERSRLVKKEGEGLTEIPTPNWDKTELRNYYMIPDQVAVLKNGNIVMASRTDTCYIYDKDSGEIINTFPCGQYFSMITKDNYIIVLDDEDQSVLIYDAEQGKIFNKIYGNFDSGTLFFVDGDTLYACSRQGILKTGLDKDSWELVLESGTFRFANQDSYRFYVRNNDFYILYYSDLSNIIKYSERTDEDKVTSELKIYSIRNSEAIREVIVEFQLKHPEIQVIYEVGLTESGSATISDSIRTLNTRIMNGEGPDIFVLEGLPVDSYVKKGILANLQDEIKEYKGELHQGILNEFTMEDGAVYMLPFSFNLPVFYAVPESVEALSSLNDLVRISEGMNEPLTGDMTFDEAFYLLYHCYPPKIFSEENVVLKNNLKEFLILVKRFCDSENVFEKQQSEYSYEQTWGRFHELCEQKTIKLAFHILKGLGYFTSQPEQLKRVGGSMNSNQNSFIPVGVLGVNKSSKRQEEAFLFLKEALSYDMQRKNQDAFSLNGFPINQLAIEGIREIDESYRSVQWGPDAVKDAANFYNNQDASELVDMINNLDKCWPMNETLYQILLEDAIPYLKGNVGIDSAVERINNRLELYVFE